MHSAPSVSYPVGRSFWGGWLLLAAWLAGVLVVAAWTLQAQAAGWRQAMAAFACLLGGAWAAIGWARGPASRLCWSGGAWQWGEPPAESTGAVHVRLDLQGLLLLEWRDADVRRWFWVERRAAPQHWAALRRAVYSRANPDALQRAEPPSATP